MVACANSTAVDAATRGCDSAKTESLLSNNLVADRLTIALYANTSGGWLPAKATCRPPYNFPWSRIDDEEMVYEVKLCDFTPDQNGLNATTPQLYMFFQARANCHDLAHSSDLSIASPSTPFDLLTGASRLPSHS